MTTISRPMGGSWEILSEHTCQGWLEGYLLTGRHGLFSSYEAFIHIVDSMFNQHAKWLKVCREIPWRRPIPSLNYLLTSHVWRQDHNGFSHQDPGFIDYVCNKKSDIVRVYLPPDANSLLFVTDHCLRSWNRINVIVAGKQPARSTQGRRRSGRSRHRRGIALPAGVFSPGNRSGRSATGPFPLQRPGQLPIAPLRRPDGEWLRLQLDLPGYPIWLRAWQVQVGRLKLYLLDSNDAANFPPYRGITSELYGGGPYLRLMQEVVLGIGGWRLLAALGMEPEVCHLNEGHAAFAVLERARSFMQATGQPFEVALAVTRAGNLFTTHTAVSAGFDRFAPALIERYLGGYAEQKLGIMLHDLLALGRANPNEPSEPFNRACLAIRGSGAVNGVSRLHGKVSRQLFEPLFPRWPVDEVPVGHVTNGVHMPTWDSPAADKLWTEACGGLYRKYPDVRPNRGGFGNSQHPSHGLPVHVRETGVVRIAPGRRGQR